MSESQKSLDCTVRNHHILSCYCVHIPFIIHFNQMSPQSWGAELCDGDHKWHMSCLWVCQTVLQIKHIGEGRLNVCVLLHVTNSMTQKPKVIGNLGLEVKKHRGQHYTTSVRPKALLLLISLVGFGCYIGKSQHCGPVFRMQFMQTTGQWETSYCSFHNFRLLCGEDAQASAQQIPRISTWWEHSKYPPIAEPNRICREVQSHVLIWKRVGKGKGWISAWPLHITFLTCLCSWMLVPREYLKYCMFV